MTPDQRFFAIMALLVALLGVAAGGFRAIWGASRKWTEVLKELEATNEDLKIVTANLKEHDTQSRKEHARLRELIAGVARSIERHIRWHAERDGR
jgi:hypothetical protein